jgi:hypothetical protein
MMLEAVSTFAKPEPVTGMAVTEAVKSWAAALRVMTGSTDATCLMMDDTPLTVTVASSTPECVNEPAGTVQTKDVFAALMEPTVQATEPNAGNAVIDSAVVMPDTRPVPVMVMVFALAKT